MSRQQLNLPKENWIKIGVQRFDELIQGANAKSLPAKVIKISTTELELLTDVAFLKHEPCILKIPRPSGGVVKIAGEFQWSKQESELPGAWLSSCRISTDFPQAYLDEIASLGYLERRGRQRYLVCESVTAHHQESDTIFTATVTEISAGGIRVFSETPWTAGDQFVLTFDERHPMIHPLHVCVVRLMQVDRGFELGCEIVSGSIDPLIAECQVSAT